MALRDISASSSLQCHAVIFDMDGVMIDSEPFWHEAMMEQFQKVNLMLTKRDCEDTMGIRITEIVELRYKQKPWNEKKLNISKQQLAHMIIDCVIHKVLTKGEPLAGLKYALDYIQAKHPNIKLAVASSSHLRLIKAVMKRLHPLIGIYDRFELYESAQDLPYGKPHPQVWLNAAERLGVSPANCLAIEDSLSGTISAKAAKMKVISIPFDYPDHKPQFIVADKVLCSLNDINDTIWNQIWNEPKSKL